MSDAIETRYFVDVSGNYLGGWATQESDWPKGGIEVPVAPVDARQIWDGQAWSESPTVRRMVAKSTVQARIIGKSKMDVAFAALMSNPVYFARWFAPDHPSVYCDDPDAVGLVQAIGLDAAEILAPGA